MVSPRPFFPKVLSNLKFIEYNYRKESFFEDYEYSNVKVYFPKYLIPPFKKFKFLKRYFFNKKTLNLIEKKSLHFDLIHAHFSCPSGYCASYLKDHLNKKFVLTMQHNQEYFLKDYYSDKKDVKDIWRNADLIIRVNKQDIPMIKEFNKTPFIFRILFLRNVLKRCQWKYQERN